VIVPVDGGSQDGWLNLCLRKSWHQYKERINEGLG
jgi:hypothetical protein